MKKNRKYLIILLLALFIEIICFNFNSLISLTYEPVDYSIYYGENFVAEDGYHKTNGNDTGYNYTVEIYDIDDYVYNIYLDVYTEIGENQRPANYVVTIADEGSEVLYWNPEKVVLNSEVSKYIKINSSGKTKRIVIEFNKESNPTTFIYGIELNQKRPFFISFNRLLIVFGVLFLFSVFNNKSKAYEFNNYFYQKIIIISFIILQIFMLYNITSVNDKYLIIKDQIQANAEYQLLAHSLAEGKVYLDIEASQELKDMSNPYDYLAKLHQGVDFKFDFAYYNEKYYVYFGVVPAVLFFLPYYLITGSDLMNYQLIFIILSLYVVGIYFLLGIFIKKYFKNIPFIMYMLFAGVIIWASGIMELAKNTNVYAVPIATGLCFMVWGLYFWLKAEGKKIHKGYLIIGSILMALVFGCRPQLGLSSVLALFIFKDHLKEYKNITVALIPYVIIGSVLMYYNYIRFGSVFDFGSTYNLTMNDMNLRGFRIDRVGLGLFTFLVQPVNITGTFPYIIPVNTTFHYLGRTIQESTFGGIFCWYPLTMLPLFIYRLREYFKNKNMYYLSILLTVFSFVILLLNIQIAGIVQRYFADFSIFLLMATIICLLSLMETKQNNKLNYLIFIFSLIAIIYSLMLVFVRDFSAIEIYNIDFYYKWYYLLQPWL